MTVATLIAFNLTLLASMASPGPALLLALKTTLTSGRMAGIVTGLGLGTMAAIWTGLALLGLEGVFNLFPWAYTALKTGGALYLIYIAYGMWKDATKPLIPTSAEAPKLRRAFFTGFAVNMGNPKSVIFASAVLLVIFPQGMSLTEKAGIALNHLLVEWIVYTLFALALSTAPARAGYLRLKPVLDRTAALILGALGLRLIFSK
ncbi:LysE family translocator [Lentibacter sp. XHP0401]|uniref:LysE family translocator n=1 Tax=Lentibacter sp. XHP0401 TaxID=2984334 RepID=UPI0021E76E9E|nr:LysE family translocator [Lentibacter sp. XHP0401]MCV2892167.1 LysE family translocator [Lentibacter sp. XHP0401]